MKIGHVHLKVRSLSRALDFYRGLLGLEVTECLPGRLAFLSAGAMHHELALQEVGEHAETPARRAVGLYHVAFEVPDRKALVVVYRTLKEAGVAVAAVDHRISWAIYCNDPDGNGIEVYWDTRLAEHGAAVWEGSDRPLVEEQLL